VEAAKAAGVALVVKNVTSAARSVTSLAASTKLADTINIPMEVDMSEMWSVLLNLRRLRLYISRLHPGTKAQ
jgi:hypothetical protein